MRSAKTPGGLTDAEPELARRTNRHPGDRGIQRAVQRAWPADRASAAGLDCHLGLFYRLLDRSLRVMARSFAL